jgi:hypothetical protein
MQTIWREVDRLQCDECKSPLMISNSKYESSEGSTEVYNTLTMVCINPKCANYCGPNLNEPLNVAKIIKNKVN